MTENTFSGPKLYPPVHFSGLQVEQKLIHMFLLPDVSFKGELQRENKLISYEGAFKMRENDMYIHPV